MSSISLKTLAWPKLSMNVTPLNVVLAGGALFIGWKAYRGWSAVGDAALAVVDPVLDAAAHRYVEISSPLVLPQVKIKSTYFNTFDFSLKPEAMAVLRRYPVLFRTVFYPDGMIRQKYLHIIDNGVAYRDDFLPEPKL
jgi:hypothetical protein